MTEITAAFVSGQWQERSFARSGRMQISRSPLEQQQPREQRPQIVTVVVVVCGSRQFFQFLRRAKWRHRPIQRGQNSAAAASQRRRQESLLHTGRYVPNIFLLPRRAKSNKCIQIPAPETVNDTITSAHRSARTQRWMAVRWTPITRNPPVHLVDI